MASETTSTNLNRRATKSVARKKTHIEKLNKPSSLMELPENEFKVDPRVQRMLNEKRRDEMAEDFRPDSMGLVTASLRTDGRLYLLDGQHRVMAARACRYEGLIAARVFTDLTLEEEAGLFLTLNRTRAVSTIEKFKVRVTLGDRTAININKILTAYGLHVNFAASHVPNTISAIVTLEKVYRGAGVWDDGEYSELVDRVIGSITKAYGSDTRAVVFSRPMIEGMGIFHATFGKKIDKERLATVLSEVPPRQIASRARTRRDATGGSIGENAAEVIHDLYNNRRRDKLPEFHKVEPKNNMAHVLDPMYVDPAQYVKAEREAEKAQKVVPEAALFPADA